MTQPLPLGHADRIHGREGGYNQAVMALVNALPQSPCADSTNVAWVETEALGDHFVRAISGSDGSDKIRGDLRLGASMSVHRQGDRFEMIWAYAGRLKAQMVDGQTAWNRAYLLLVHRPMCRNCLAAQLDAAVARWSYRRLNPDPTRSLMSPVFFPPQIRRDRLSPLEISDMTAYEAQRFAGNVPMSGVRHRCQRGGLSAPALAYPARIWRGNRLGSRSDAFRPMALQVGLLGTLHHAVTRFWINARILSAATFAQHAPMVTKAV